jgi:Bacterial protein of unknown function (DUF899)
VKLPRFRGHPNFGVFGVHNGKKAPALYAGIPPADDRAGSSPGKLKHPAFIRRRSLRPIHRCSSHCLVSAHGIDHGAQISGGSQYDYGSVTSDTIYGGGSLSWPASTSTILHPPIVSRDQWLAERKKLLAHEKELTKHRDRINAERRRLPMVKLEKDYIFDGN